MKLAVLPFNAADGAKPALGRQLSNFAADIVRAGGEAEINSVKLLARVEEEDGSVRAAFVNISNTLVEYEFIKPLFENAEADRVIDGLLTQDGDSISLTVRAHDRDNEKPIEEKEFHSTTAEVFGLLKDLIALYARLAEVEITLEGFDFGTDNPQAFLKFLEGHDSLVYIQEAQGNVAKEFSPEPAFESLLEAVESDPDFLAPYESLVQLCRGCSHYRIGNFEIVEAALKKLTLLIPDDFRAFYALGELYSVIGNHGKAAEAYEDALSAHTSTEDEKKEEADSYKDWKQEQASMLGRLGQSQMMMGMPVNAERNLRKSVDLEPDLSVITMLSQVLQQTNRPHEVPALYKQFLDKQPDNGALNAGYAVSLIQAGNEAEGVAAFERGLEVVAENAMVKRYYAPYLVQKGELDRAMDFYEDCLDVSPNEVPILLEYAQTLQQAEREFEIPKVLKDVLASNPDPNTRAQTLAWLTELEQPKRAEAVRNAEAKMEAGDFAGVVRDLRPLRNWMADYWKLWAMLAAAHNRLNEPVEAQEAAEKLINLFPGCEPAYVELSAALTAQERMEDAYNVMRFAAGNMPSSLPIHLNLALAAKRAGREDEAKAMAKQIREAIGPNPELEPVLAEIES